MGELLVRQAARRAALDAQAGHRRERQEPDRRIDALAVNVMVALDERDAAERRAGELQTMINRGQLSLRQAIAWVGDTISVRSATRLLGTHSPTTGSRTPDPNGSNVGVRVRVDQTGLR